MLILLSKNKKIINEYLSNNAKVGLIATASELDNNRDYMENDKQDLIRYGYSLIDIDLTNEDETTIKEKFSKIDALFVAGGNVFYLLEQIKIKNVLGALKIFAKEKIYIGSSAGSALSCPNVKYCEKFDDIKVAPLLNDYEAMNLVDFYFLPHYKAKEKYTKMADTIIKENPNMKFIKIRNDEAIVVINNHYQIVNTD